MALGELRRQARICALTTVAEYARSMGEEGTDPEELGMTEDEHNLFREECKKVAALLNKRANKLS